MNKIPKYLTIALFFGILIIFPLITVIAPKKYFSEIENRNLAIFPEFDLTDIKNQKYMKDIEVYLSDHFIKRTDWIKVKTNLELFSGKKEINDVYVLKNRLIEKLYTPDYVSVENNINAINKFALKVNKPVFVMIVPTAAGIYYEELPKHSLKFSQKPFIDEVYSSFNNEKVTTLDAYNALFATRDEYIFYRNDHHWTTLGAYYAYASTIKKMGFSPVLLNKYEIEHASSDFKGTLYSKSLYDRIKPDVLDFYNYSNGAKVTSVLINNGIDETEYSSIFFRDYLNKKDKYSAFLGTNQPVISIKTNAENNNKLLVIKDSYANCYAPFLIQHYSEITLIDLRYINKSLDELVDLNSFSQVLFLYNSANFSVDDNIKKLNIIK